MKYSEAVEAYSSAVTGNKAIDEQSKILQTELRELKRKENRCKDDKGMLLRLINEKGVLEATEERKRLSEINTLIETVLFSFKTKEAELAQLIASKIPDEKLRVLRDGISFPEKHFLRGILEDLKKDFLEKNSGLIKMIWACSLQVDNLNNLDTVFAKLFRDVAEPKIDCLEPIVNSIKELYKERFTKEDAKW